MDTINNKYEFKVHRKNAITNIHIKPTSCIDPNIIKSVFKVYSSVFLHRAHSICSEKYIKEEENCLIDMFVENDHSKQLLKNLVIKCNKKKIIRTITKITLDSKHQSKSKTWVEENKERYCFHVWKKSATNSLPKKQTQSATK